MEHQKHVVAEIDVCIKLIEQMAHASESGEDMAMNTVMAMRGMDRLFTLLEPPPVVCEIQTAFATQEDVE